MANVFLTETANLLKKAMPYEFGNDRLAYRIALNQSKNMATVPADARAFAIEILKVYAKNCTAFVWGQDVNPYTAAIARI